MSRNQHIDLLIVGGGPAGLATALAARQRGLHRVVVVDDRRRPIDKPCGEGLMPDGVAVLRELGVHLPRHQCTPFSGIRYIDGAVEATGTFPRASGLGVRRPMLHAVMVQAAERAGVELRWATRVERLLPATLNSHRTSGSAGVEIAEGPILGLAKVRSTTQFSRNKMELQLLADKWYSTHGVIIDTVEFELGREGPLSWKLTDREWCNLFCGWYDAKNLEQRHKVLAQFQGSPGNWPDQPDTSWLPERCAHDGLSVADICAPP